MKLLEMKKKVLALIEEIDDTQTSLTNDPDIEAKLPYVINQIIFELARFKKIPEYVEQEVKEGTTFDLKDLDNFYQLQIVRGIKYDFLTETLIRFLENGTAEISYYKYPQRIDINTPDTYEFDLSEDALEIAVYGIAADLLKSDISNNNGIIYANRYKELMQTLDPRYQLGVIEITDGIEL
ncbi:MAG: hypothetical protein IJB83_02705 [Bacilli bacterium]|nr:hypothetical protein [Bacilli bacterium]